MVSTHLKDISQSGSFHQVKVKIKIFELPPPRFPFQIFRPPKRIRSNPTLPWGDWFFSPRLWGIDSTVSGSHPWKGLRLQDLTVLTAGMAGQFFDENIYHSSKNGVVTGSICFYCGVCGVTQPFLMFQGLALTLWHLITMYSEVLSDPTRRLQILEKTTPQNADYDGHQDDMKPKSLVHFLPRHPGRCFFVVVLQGS